MVLWHLFTCFNVTKMRTQFKSWEYILNLKSQYMFFIVLLFCCLWMWWGGLHTNSTIKFADDTAVVRMITSGDKSACKEEVQNTVEWCDENNLAVFLQKQKELIVGFRKHRATENTSIYLWGDKMKRISSSWIIGIHITGELSWTLNTSFLKKKKKGTSAQNASTSPVTCWKMSIHTAERNLATASQSDRTDAHQSEKPYSMKPKLPNK